jgi:hypothetical protein
MTKYYIKKHPSDGYDEILHKKHPIEMDRYYVRNIQTSNFCENSVKEVSQSVSQVSQFRPDITQEEHLWASRLKA